MIFNKQVMIPALIALLIGATVFTVVQVRKPDPLSSSAFEPESCSAIADTWRELNEDNNERPILQDDWRRNNEELRRLVGEYQNCRNIVCEPLAREFSRLYSLRDQAEELVDQIQGEIGQFVASNPQPWMGQVASNWEALNARFLDAEDEFLRVNRLLEDADRRYGEAGCEGSEGEPVDQGSSCYGRTINGQEWCVESLYDEDDDQTGFGSGSGMGAGSY